MVNFVPAVAYHFCLNLPAAFTHSRAHLLAKSCTYLRGHSQMMSVVRGVGLILTKEGRLHEFGTAKGGGVKNTKNLADIIVRGSLCNNRILIIPQI